MKLGSATGSIEGARKMVNWRKICNEHRIYSRQKGIGK